MCRAVGGVGGGTSRLLQPRFSPLHVETGRELSGQAGISGRVNGSLGKAQRQGCCLVRQHGHYQVGLVGLKCSRGGKARFWEGKVTYCVLRARENSPVSPVLASQAALHSPY